jgi:hypothetical protein
MNIIFDSEMAPPETIARLIPLLSHEDLTVLRDLMGNRIWELHKQRSNELKSIIEGGSNA